MQKILLNYSIEKEFDIIVYIDSTYGDDKNNGLTETAPIKTINRANEIFNSSGKTDTALCTLNTLELDVSKLEYTSVVSKCYNIVNLQAIKVVDTETTLINKDITFYTCDVRGPLCSSFAYGSSVTFNACEIKLDCDVFSKDLMETVLEDEVEIERLAKSCNIVLNYCTLHGTIRAFDESNNSISFIKCLIDDSMEEVVSTRISQSEYCIQSDELNKEDYGMTASMYFVALRLTLPEIIRNNSIEKFKIINKNNAEFVDIEVDVDKKKVLDIDPKSLDSPKSLFELRKFTSYELRAKGSVIPAINSLSGKVEESSTHIYTPYNIEVTPDSMQYKVSFLSWIDNSSLEAYKVFNRTESEIVCHENCLPEILLQSTYLLTLSGIKIVTKHPEDCIRGFVVSVSNDGIKWNEVYTEPTNSTFLYDNLELSRFFGATYVGYYVKIRVLTSKSNTPIIDYIDFYK